MALKICKDCGNKISKSAKTCPQCGARQKKGGCLGGFFKLILYLIIGIIIISVISYLLNPEADKNIQQTELNETKEEVKTPVTKTNDWTGTYIGRDKCTMGRNKNNWSNSYSITIVQYDSECDIKGIYFQRNKTIKGQIKGNQLTIPEQNIGDSSFIIRGKGTKNGNMLTIEYEVDVLVNSEYLTNYCSAEYTLD